MRLGTLTISYGQTISENNATRRATVISKFLLSLGLAAQFFFLYLALVFPLRQTLVPQCKPAKTILCSRDSKRFRKIVEKKRSDFSPLRKAANLRMRRFELAWNRAGGLGRTGEAADEYPEAIR